MLLAIFMYWFTFEWERIHMDILQTNMHVNLDWIGGMDTVVQEPKTMNEHC